MDCQYQVLWLAGETEEILWITANDWRLPTLGGITPIYPQNYGSKIGLVFEIPRTDT